MIWPLAYDRAASLSVTLTHRLSHLVSKQKHGDARNTLLDALGPLHTSWCHYGGFVRVLYTLCDCNLQKRQ